MVLKVDSINTFYGNLQALWNVSLEVREGEIIALIGSNGAGKTTFLKSVMGARKVKSGEMFLNGVKITGLPPNKRVLAGITICPEGRQIFPLLTVWENLRIGAYLGKKADFEDSLHRVYGLFPILKERRQQIGGTLSGGEQQMLAIGRALMSRPKLLLLDEPSLGLSPLLTEKIFELIKEINKQGTAIVLVEQNAVMALLIADRGYVLKTGFIVKTDTGENLLASDEIISSYLGE